MAAGSAGILTSEFPKQEKKKKKSGLITNKIERSQNLSLAIDAAYRNEYS